VGTMASNIGYNKLNLTYPPLPNGGPYGSDPSGVGTGTEIPVSSFYIFVAMNRRASS